MKLKIGQLQVALDALNGSCHIFDNGNLFTYSRSTRERVRNELSDFLGNIELEIELIEVSGKIIDGGLG